MQSFYSFATPGYIASYLFIIIIFFSYFVCRFADKSHNVCPARSHRTPPSPPLSLTSPVLVYKREHACEYINTCTREAFELFKGVSIVVNGRGCIYSFSAAESSLFFKRANRRPPGAPRPVYRRRRAF